MRSTVLAFLLLSARGGVAGAGRMAGLQGPAPRPCAQSAPVLAVAGRRAAVCAAVGHSAEAAPPGERPAGRCRRHRAGAGRAAACLPPAPAAAAAAAPLPWYARLTPWHALAAVWLVGVLVLAVRGAVGYLKLKRCVALACKTPDGCYGGACVPTPFTLGFVRPRVYLPDSLQGPGAGRLCCCMTDPHPPPRPACETAVLCRRLPALVQSAGVAGLARL